MKAVQLYKFINKGKGNFAQKMGKNFDYWQKVYFLADYLSFSHEREVK
jgi:hypothetical protein